MSHVLKYERPMRGEVPGWRGADELAKKLQEAACSGTDPAIPFSLPHTRAINGSKKGASSHWHCKLYLMSCKNGIDDAILIVCLP